MQLKKNVDFIVLASKMKGYVAVVVCSIIFTVVRKGAAVNSTGNDIAFSFNRFINCILNPEHIDHFTKDRSPL